MQGHSVELCHNQATVNVKTGIAKRIDYWNIEQPYYILFGLGFTHYFFLLTGEK